jgi:hypothetical protein
MNLDYLKRLDVKYENKWLQFIDVEDKLGCTMSGIRPAQEGVAVLPYKINDSGNISEIGVHLEMNPLWGKGQHMTCITGGIEKNESPIGAAYRELLEESGLCRIDNRIDPVIIDLGEGLLSKCTMSTQYLFAIRIDKNFIQKEPSGDGTTNERLSKFSWIPVTTYLDFFKNKTERKCLLLKTLVLSVLFEV